MTDSIIHYRRFVSPIYSVTTYVDEFGVAHAYANDDPTTQYTGWDEKQAIANLVRSHPTVPKDSINLTTFIARATIWIICVLVAATFIITATSLLIDAFG